MYRVTIDEHTRQQLDALPPEGKAAWRELYATLEVAPKNGRPLFPNKPEGVFTWQFGPHREGIAYYVVVEHARQVAVEEVTWLR